MTELHDRVVARLVAAQNARDPAPLRGEDAVGDALALLREAAPSPEGAIDLGSVSAVCWTFWLRHQGPEDPDAQRNVTIMVSTLGFLCPRLSADAQLPGPLRDAFDPADPAHDARFAYLVSSAYGEAVLNSPDGGPDSAPAGAPDDVLVNAPDGLLVNALDNSLVNAPQLGKPDRLTALDRALAWSATAHQYLPEDHEGFVELALHTLGLNMMRFQLAADPEALAAAARHAGAVCERLPSVGLSSLGPAGAEAAALALRTVLDAARLLGEPALDEVERLVAAAPDEALTPEAAEGLNFLRALHAEPFSWPGERDLRVGSLIADAGVSEHDASRIACGVRRLRAALAHTPAGHPARPLVTAALGRALDAFARERGDDEAAREAAREAAELLATVDVTGTMSGTGEELLAELLAAVREVKELRPGDDPHRVQNAGLSLGRVIEQLKERTTRNGEPSPVPDIEIEILYITTALGNPDAISDQRISRYRAALGALPADQPHRHAYVAVLAALTGARAQALQETEPARAAQLAAEARSLTDEAAAGAPADFLPLGLLRRGRFDVALPVALSTIGTDLPDGAADARAADLRTMAPGHPLIGALADIVDSVSDTADGELAKLGFLLSRLDDIRLDDPEHLASDIAVLRELLAEIGEDDPFVRAPVAGTLGSALSALGAGQGDPATLGEALDEAVPLLRYARSHTSDFPGELDQVLAFALTFQSIGSFDAEMAREASALLASAATEGAPADINLAVLSARTEFFNAVQNYLFGHEPGQLVRAREIARRLKELIAEPSDEAGERLPGLDVMGDALLDLVESIGPGGGPKPDLTDDQVDQCRRTFEACPADHPMRIFTASTLLRMLTQRAVVVRGADPEHGARLVAEADEVLRAVEEEAPASWADTMRTFIGAIDQGRLPPILPSERPDEAPLSPLDQPPGAPLQAPVNAMEAMLAVLRTQPSGAADDAAWTGPMIPVWMRAHGELGAAAGALGRGQPVDLALSHLEAAVEAMADITDRGSDQQSAEHGLTSFEGDIRSIIELVLLRALGREAAAWARDLRDELAAALREQRPPAALPTPESLFRIVAGPDVDRATELLERGRGLLLSRRIEARTDLSGLRSEHPALADEFERLTDQLTAEPDLPDPAPSGHAEWSRLARLRASRELDELVERIRTRPGFDGFLRPLSVEQLRALAADGPIVVLNHARRHCHALVVTARSITALRLEAESDEVTDAARRLRDAVDAINAHGASRPSPAQLIAAGATLRETLAWTWHKIVCPVLELVGSRDPVPEASDARGVSDVPGVPDEGAWPRIWWVPTGSFNALPLHAAECTLPDCELDGCGAALDAVVSSYVPGFRTLAYARTRAEHRNAADNGSALLVASPEDELPGVAAAAGYAAGLLGAREPLVGAAATREAVLAALGSTPWVHFGCHAATDPTEPSGSLLHLPSGEPLSVLEICRTQPRSARLAFLAACGTARTSERLSDEAIHITSAFLLAGFPTAVGTLWEIDSTHADHVTRDFYRSMTATGAGTSAYALHHTVRELRRRIPDRPHVWAAYVHAGT
ncbi:CHAT domain-containing protein [Streptomyces sp. NPDC058280]|uniref:CHAT domain-containing protein n=1 Tax=Streptomyces sp. NPDC058280 TaxID=3346419 RepID=UPI0036ED8273